MNQNMSRIRNKKVEYFLMKGGEKGGEGERKKSEGEKFKFNERREVGSKGERGGEKDKTKHEKQKSEEARTKT